jgi:putative flippase GtrA
MTPTSRHRLACRHARQADGWGREGRGASNYSRPHLGRCEADTELVPARSFATVGLSGYIVNLAVFAVCSRTLCLHHLAAATAASVAAANNNFVWNRRWTFEARARRQAIRLLVVSTLFFLLAALVFDLLVRLTPLSPVVAQALSIASATPFSFLANKFWTFAWEQQG